MSKKAPVKKTKRRLKRSIRRSIAAVLMITAIGIAAIPVPENYAEEETSGVETTSAVEEPSAYKYAVDSKDDDYNTYSNNITSVIDANGTKKDTDKSYTILEGGDFPRLIWQFEYFTTSDGSNSYGIISGYNAKYIQGTIYIEDNIVEKYRTIDESAYDEYYKGTKNEEGTVTKQGRDEYEYDMSTVDQDTEYFFETYFSGDYQTYLENYQKYLENPQKYLEDPKNNNTAPTLKRKVNQLTDNQKLQYYCDQNGLKGYRLVKVIDEEKITGTNAYVYIPKKIEIGTDDTGLDKNGYYVEDFASIIGIGDGVFKGVTNVTSLVTSEKYSLKYIGVSAFEGSYLQNIDISNVENISDFAFKDCGHLTSIEFGNGTSIIGTEAFSGSGLQEIEFPSNISVIGPGAFSNCKALRKVDFSKITTYNYPLKISKYAFYNAVALDSVIFMASGTDTTMEDFDKPTADTTVNIDSIGDGAFAVADPPTGSMSIFTFPSQISKSNSMGDCILAGRTNLKYVTMPASFGSQSGVTVPVNTFYYCINLECVKFPDNGNGSCGKATYNPELFATVSNNAFYVKGPELTGIGGDYASPRKATWDAHTSVRDDEGNYIPVPYLYIKGNKEYYEVSDGNYLMCINSDGILTSCTLKTEPSDKDKRIDLVIPATVGTTNVVGIATDCFKDGTLKSWVKSVTIKDNSISEIEENVFKDWDKLQKVVIGNSVTKIGANAFQGCTSLVDVTFHSPKGGHEPETFPLEQIGDNAFATGSSQLTFHGDIVDGYGPFEWATKADNFVNERYNIRVCYQSLAPTYLTVMYNPITEMVTLLDYPKADQIEDILNTAHAGEFGNTVDRNGKPITKYTDLMVDSWYRRYPYGDTVADEMRKNFANEWAAATNEEEREKLYEESGNYGPWVSPEFCKEWSDWLSGNPHIATSKGNDEGINEGNDDATAKETILDWLFEPIVAYASETEESGGTGGSGTIGDPKPYYDYYTYDVLENYMAEQNKEPSSAYRALSTEESALIDSIMNVKIPKGVDSIDVYGYRYNLDVDGNISSGPNGELNTNNYTTYLKGKYWDNKTESMYLRINSDSDDNTDVVPGLFSGYYVDYTNASDYELYKRGNDLVTSIELNSVKYLPDYAFDSCERLQSVILGDYCEDIGTAPFRGCYSLTGVSNNDYYKTDNGIVYSVNTDGSYTIEECLSGRGNPAVVGQSMVCLTNDPNLAMVSAIRKGAFEDCDSITDISFGSNDTAGLTEIPEDCFRNCDNLQNVVLPMTVNDIGKNAFSDADSLGYLTIYGKEVKISGSAFADNNDNDKKLTRVRAYENSAPERYVKEYADEYYLAMDSTYLGEQWKVSFMDSNGILFEELVDRKGNSLDNPQYVVNGDSATEPEDPQGDDWVFEKWIGTNGTEIKDDILEDTVFIAQVYSTNGMINGKYSVAFYDQVDGAQIGVTQYIEPGKAAIAPQAPVHTGYSFLKWSSEEYTNVQKNLTIMAMYSGSGTGTTSGGSTNTSGGATTTSGTTTSGKTTSTSTSSTSNTSSSSSTSATSTTAAATGQYVVTVIGGSGSGTYAQGTTVQIIANTPAAGKVFSKWTTDSQGVTLASVSTTPTTFVMPANNVTITAEYTDGTATPAANSVNGTATANNNTNNTGTQDGNTRVDITKPGISNKDLATANVNGSSDNFVVKISETDEATQAVAAALTKKYGSLENILYYAMDISLYDSTGTTKITDTTGLSVDITIPLPDALLSYGGNNMAGAAINYNPLENAQLEEISEKFTTINGVPCITFTATHFSPYTVYVDTGNLTEGMLDVTPKTGDPIHPKWFLSLGLACLSIILFMKKDKNTAKPKTA